MLRAGNKIRGGEKPRPLLLGGYKMIDTELVRKAKTTSGIIKEIDNAWRDYTVLKNSILECF